MNSYLSLEAAEQSGAKEILLDTQTNRFWTTDNPLAARACLRVGMVHASTWRWTKDEVLGMVDDYKPVSGVLRWLAVICGFLLNLALAWWLKMRNNK